MLPVQMHALKLTSCTRPVSRLQSSAPRATVKRGQHLPIGMLHIPKAVDSPMGKSETERKLASLNSEHPVDLQSPIGQPAVALCGLGGFGMVTVDVFGEHSLHLLHNLDVGVHQYIVQHTSETVRVVVGDYIVSDVPILLAFVVWSYITFKVLMHPSLRTFIPLLACWAVLVANGGFILHGDPGLVGFLKDTFHRARPSDLHHSFSYPSGHTTGAAFVWGVALYILLPLVQTIEADTKTKEFWQNVNIRGTQVLLYIWLLATATTATGRILADVHWVSDILAGFMLATFGVSTLSMACNMMSLFPVAADAMLPSTKVTNATQPHAAPIRTVAARFKSMVNLL